MQIFAITRRFRHEIDEDFQAVAESFDCDAHHVMFMLALLTRQEHRPDPHGCDLRRDYFIRRHSKWQTGADGAQGDDVIHTVMLSPPDRVALPRVPQSRQHRDGAALPHAAAGWGYPLASDVANFDVTFV